MPLKFNTANGAIIVSAEDGSGDAAVTFPRSGYVEPTHTGNVSITGDLTTTGAVDITGDVVVAGDLAVDRYSEVSVNLGTMTGNVDIDLTTGNLFRGLQGGSVTFTFSNIPASTLIQGFTLLINTNLITPQPITWPSNVKWSGGTAPDTLGTGDYDVYVFFNIGTGAWYGFQAGDAMS
jgi:hypothetical protein